MRPTPDEPVQEEPEVIRAWQPNVVRFKSSPIVQIPPDQHDAALRAQHRRLHIPEIVGSVGDPTEAVGVGASPARLLGYQEATDVAAGRRASCSHVMS